MRKQLLTACVVLVAAMAVSSAKAATHTVNQSGNSFSPFDVVVEPGDTIEWVWSGGTHTVTSGAPCTADGRFDMPLDSVNTLASFVVPMDEPNGVIDYFCIPHCAIFNMVGTITVEGPADVPTVSEWGVVIMALLVIVAGSVFFALRKHSTAAMSR